MIDPTSFSAQQGDLLIAWKEERRKGHSLILPHLAGDPVERLLRLLLSDDDGSLRTRVLRPPRQMHLDASIAWHTDAWLALPDIARKRGAVVAGPTASHIRGFSGRIVFVVTPPEHIGLRSKHAAHLLRATGTRRKANLSAVVNRQTRLLVRNADRLQDGGAISPSKLRAGLRKVELVTIDRLPEIASEVAAVLALDASAAAQQAKEVLGRFSAENTFDALSVDDRRRFLGLNSLDAALWKLARKEASGSGA
jgi:hypothetical protein